MSISQEIIAILNDLCEKFGIAIDWTADNILPYVQTLCEKFIQFEIWTSVFWIALMWSVLLVLWIIATPCWINANKKDWDLSEGGFVLTCAFIAMALVWSLSTVAVTGVQVFDIIEATVFPEKTIYDYIMGVIQSNPR